MKQIFDYSDYVADYAHLDRNCLGEGIRKNLEFFSIADEGICPFCKTSSEKVFSDGSFDEPEWLYGGHQRLDEEVWSCKHCGWWKIRTDKETTGFLDAKSAVIKNAVIKKYDLSDKEIPIELLQKYLRNNFEDVIHINDQRMEKLVQAVFSEHFACEVIHVGKSSDGGVDLILIDSDSPTLVQVKRRKSLPYTEPVKGIREFLGATVLSEKKNCIYVSTCSKFSKAAIEAANKAVNVGAVESYELYDFKRLRDVLKFAVPANADPAWKKYLGIE